MYRDYVDISVAVASPRGLVVPVLRNAEALSFAGVELKLAELAKKVRCSLCARSSNCRDRASLRIIMRRS